MRGRPPPPAVRAAAAAAPLPPVRPHLLLALHAPRRVAGAARRGARAADVLPVQGEAGPRQPGVGQKVGVLFGA